MKREAYTHSKIGRLCRLLNIEPAHARGIVASLWYVTSVEAPAGDIGKLENEDIAEQVGTQIEPDRLVSALVDSRWLDESVKCRLIVHDWPEHCEDSVHRKIARKGLFFADGSMPNLSRFAAHERESIAAAYKPKASAQQAPTGRTPGARIEPKAEPKPEPKPKKADAPDAEADFDLFWRVYPRKVAKPQALKAWRETVKVRPRVHAILAALKADIEARSDRPDWLKFFKHPATWLRAQSWNDEVLVERMGYAGPVTTPVPALLAAAPEVTPQAAPEVVPTTPDEIERESWVDTFRSHGLPEAAAEAEACSMDRLRELQALHEKAIERRRAEVLAKVLGRRVA